MGAFPKEHCRLPMLAIALSATLGSCGFSVPGPPVANHPKSAFVEVPYPPPAALVEAVPPSPGSPLVWLDGYWTWQGQYYTWVRGGWVFVSAGQAFAPWQLIYARDGQLMFAPGAWYANGNVRIRPPEIRTPAYTPPNETTPEFQTAR
jgi:hypothetical protein